MAAKEGSTFTARDFELLTGAFKCLKGDVVVDYNKYAARLGFKNSASAKASWHALKKKLDKLEAAGAHLAPSLTVDEVPSKKRAADDGDSEEAEGVGSGDEEDGAAVEPPAKKGKKAPAEKKAPSEKKTPKSRGKKIAVVKVEAAVDEVAAEGGD